MHFAATPSVIAFAIITTVSAQVGTTIKVLVGANGLTYTPNDIVAEVGTAVDFFFFPKNHTVTQSSFFDPCHPLSNGFFSGFVPTAVRNPNITKFTITVSDKNPIWIYCGQTNGNHCQSGMVAAINAPATGNTFEAFRNLAKNATLSTSPAGGPKGGILSIDEGNGTASLSSASPVRSTKSSAAIMISSLASSKASVSDTTTVITTSAGSIPTTYTSATTWDIPTPPLATGNASSVSGPSAMFLLSNGENRLGSSIFGAGAAFVGVVFAFF